MTTETCPKCGAKTELKTRQFTGKLVGFIGTLIFEDVQDLEHWQYAQHENSPLMLEDLKELIETCEKTCVRVITRNDDGLVRYEPI